MSEWEKEFDEKWNIDNINECSNELCDKYSGRCGDCVKENWKLYIRKLLAEKDKEIAIMDKALRILGYRICTECRNSCAEEGLSPQCDKEHCHIYDEILIAEQAKKQIEEEGK